MRAPYQVLVIPYKVIDKTAKYCVLHRADMDQWQFIAGGGEDNETPFEAAKRETLEEGGVKANNLIELKSLSYIPAEVISEKCRMHWNKDTYVIPEYTFAFECEDEIKLSREHVECAWLTYEKAIKKLKWDSNKTALYELNCRLCAKPKSEN